MSFEALMGQAAQLGMAVEAAAAAGTHLRSTLDCAVVHESVADHLEQITELALPGASQLPKPQREALAGVLISILRQAADLVEHPSRAPHWDVTDDVLVQSTARASMSVALVLAEVDYFLRAERAAMRKLTAEILDPATTYELEPVFPQDLVRALTLDAKFASLELGLVDGMVAAVAERRRVYRVLTTDRRDLMAVRIGARYDRALEIVPA